MTKCILAKDKCKRAINRRRNLVFRWRNYHPTDSKQSLSFLSCFLSSWTLLHFALARFPFISSSSTNKTFLLCWILQIALKVPNSEFTVVKRAQSKSPDSKLNSDSSDEKEMILEQNLLVLVPKHTGTIRFAFHFLKQIQRADRGAIVFGSWVDVISDRRPRLPKTWSQNTSSATLKEYRKSRIQPN